MSRISKIIHTILWVFFVGTAITLAPHAYELHQFGVEFINMHHIVDKN